MQKNEKHGKRSLSKIKDIFVVKYNTRNSVFKYKYFFILVFLMFFVKINILADTKKPNAITVQVKTGHPILFVTPNLISQIQQKTTNLQTFHNYVRSSRENVTDINNTSGIRAITDVRTNETRMHPNYFINDAMYYGLDAFFNNDELSKEYAKQYIKSIIARPAGFPSRNDNQPRGKIYALGMLYDWVYDYLSDDEKRQIRIKILELMDYLDTEYHYYSGPHYLGGHRRLANIVALVGLLPIYHDIHLDTNDVQDRYNTYLESVVNLWRNGYNPVAKWISKNGGHHMGWAYGTSYSELTPYIVWEYATNEESWFSNWQANKTFFFLYGLRNDNNYQAYLNGGYGTFPYSGDVWYTAYSASFHGFQLLTATHFFNNDYAKWLYTHMGINTKYYWDLLYRNYNAGDELNPNNLPLSRHFENSGYVIVRDSWDFSQNTLAVFKSSSFYSTNHHHKDQNAFTVYYKGPLAIDSGGYGSLGEYGSEHWKNYYTRTIAHNSITVYDPSEVFNYGGRLSNDGGQYFFPSGYPSFNQIREGGVNHLDGIVYYEEKNDYTYSMGNATKAYKASKLSLFQRHFIYLRNHSYNHPVIIVYDKVVSTNSNFKKTYLLHSINEPDIYNNIVRINIDDGINSSNKATLYDEVLLPSTPQIVKIGGRSNHQEFYVADDGTGNPRNYNNGIDYNNLTFGAEKQLREAGQWRIELSPTLSSTNDVFLNVLSITDGSNSESNVNTSYISSNNFDGVIIKDNDGQQSTLVLIKKTNIALNDVLTLPQNYSFNKVLVVGVQLNTKYSISKTNSTLTIIQTNNGENTSSGQGTIYSDFNQTGNDTELPTVPQNLTATAVSSSQVNLRWSTSTDNVGVIGYRIYRNGTHIADEPSISYNDTGLTALTPYTYTILAYDAAGNESGSSNQAIATTLLDNNGGGGGNTNHAPILSPIGNKTMKVKELLSFKLHASDKDNDRLTFRASNLPYGAKFNNKTGEFSWIPKRVGRYYVIFSVSDGKSSDGESIMIRVKRSGDNNDKDNKYGIAMELKAERKTDKSWLSQKNYGSISLYIKKGNEHISKLVLYRKVSGEIFKALKEYNYSGEGTLNMNDTYLDSNTVYTYKIMAIDSNNKIIASSLEVSI